MILRIFFSIATTAILLSYLPSQVLADDGNIDERRAKYEFAQSFRRRISGDVFRQKISPNWFGDDDRFFWYHVRISSNQSRYILVDAERGSRAPAFDHQHLARVLGKEIDQSLNPDNLRLSSLVFTRDAKSCRFRLNGKRWQFELPRGRLTQLKGIPDEDQNEGFDDDGFLKPQKTIARSRGRGEETAIRIINQLDQPLTLYWIQESGQRRSYGTVKAKSQYEQHTFDGHAWLLVDVDDNPVASFVADESQIDAVVDRDTPKPKPGRANRGRKSRGPDQRTSPDGKFRIQVENNNVTLKELNTSKELNESDNSERKLTNDGTQQHGYDSNVWWSPDSKHFVVLKTQRVETRRINIVKSSPAGSIDAELLNIPYAKPGDPMDKSVPVLFHVDRWKPIEIDDDLFPNPYSISQFAWHESSRSFSFVYNERGHQRLRVISVDAETGTARAMIDEKSDTFVCYSQKLFLDRLDATNEAIWMSERSGWNHLYLIDQATGKVKNAITGGQWVVREVVRVDEETRKIWFSAGGYEEGQDPYHVHLFRVNFDGSELTKLTGGDGTHRWEFSPNKKYLIDRYSRVDLPPVTVLRNADTGSEIVPLEAADASDLLESGWRMPERFVAPGRDGKTPIHGIIIRPTQFDPQKRYPVVEDIYAGPHSAFVPKSWGLHNRLYQMADLGFIVVKIDGMGTSHRSKSFHDVCWKNIADSGFPDRVAWIKAAAESRPEMDTTRVGIYGGSAGGQSAMRALIDHGNFYKAAVADCGCHDNRVDKRWWNEQWMGWPIGPHYRQQSNATGAKKITGDLMLIWGELDTNVDPVSSMQVVDALIKANKNFEMLIVPGAGHGAAGTPYATWRQAEFLMRNLQ